MSIGDMPLPSQPHLLNRRIIAAAVTLMLCLHWWLAVSATFRKSITSDEGIHIVSGYSYWKYNDYRLQPENGNLPQRWAAIPLLAQSPNLDPHDNPDEWISSDNWLIADRFLYHNGNPSDFMVATSRAMMALWSVALALLVWFWSRKLWGEEAGLFSLALFAFSCTTLAHGPLATSDTVAAFALLVWRGR